MKSPTLGDHFTDRCEERQKGFETTIMRLYDWAANLEEQAKAMREWARQMEKTLK